jgi:hypothetical protein
MRRIVTACALGAAMLGGCSQKAEESRDVAERTSNAPEGGAARSEVAAPAADSAIRAPGIDVTAAPGVAFNYRYAFVLPDTSISAVQEVHASACEKLGPARCRITGMRYTLVDEDEVRGELQFKLDPTLARNFGKEGIAAVEKAEGTLVDASIEGRDVATGIDQSQRRSQQNSSELTRIEARLAAGGLGDAERATLTAQAGRLRQQQAQEQATRDQGEEMLADTPMTFSYAGNKGYAIGGSSIRDAWDATSSSFATMVSFILLLIGTLLPWAVLGLLLIALWRFTPLGKLLRRKRAQPEASAVPVASAEAPPSA